MDIRYAGGYLPHSTRAANARPPTEATASPVVSDAGEHKPARDTQQDDGRLTGYTGRSNKR